MSQGGDMVNFPRMILRTPNQWGVDGLLMLPVRNRGRPYPEIKHSCGRRKCVWKSADQLTISFIITAEARLEASSAEVQLSETPADASWRYDELLPQTPTTRG
eukprot:s209_g2.t1